MTTEDEKEVIECRVTNMVGETSVHGTSAIEELRVRLAMEAGVLSPCILLFKQSDNTVVENSHNLAHIFDGESYKLYSINIKECIIKNNDVLQWSAEEWSHIFRSHARYGDKRVIEHAEPLISRTYDGFQEKMRVWAKELVNDAWSFEGLDTHAELIKSAIALGVNMVDVTDHFQRTLLHQAANCGHMDVLHALIEAKLNVNAISNSGQTPLYWAASKGYIEAVRALLSAGANPSSGNDRARNPIHEAAYNGHLDVVNLLIRERADVNGTNAYDSTPLHLASASGRVEMIHTLLRAGADVNVRNKGGGTPYDIARSEECRKVLGVQ